MTKIVTMLLCACSLLAACDGSATSRAPSPKRPVIEMPPAAEVTSLSTSSNQLAFTLWGRARAQPGNLALSPISISTALAMTWGGAKGQTADEMRATLHLDGTPDTVMARWGRLAGALQNPARPLQLRIANRLSGERSFRFEQPFLDRTKAAYGAPLEAVDFRAAPDASRTAINRWVEGETERRIKDLLPPGTITERGASTEDSAEARSGVVGLVRPSSYAPNSASSCGSRALRREVRTPVVWEASQWCNGLQPTDFSSRDHGKRSVLRLDEAERTRSMVVTRNRSRLMTHTRERFSNRRCGS
jgi:hypothetical protein